MNCPVCARWSPPDPQTGYDVDALCPRCQADGWTELSDGELVNDAEPELLVETLRVKGR